jgi:MOSC domain-containing protein YiiM
MTTVEVVQLLVSAAHRYVGRPADGAAPGPDDELVHRIEVRRNLGIVGDRYFGKPAHRNAAITIMSAENLPVDIDPAVGLQQTRRNILIRGVDIDSFVGETVTLDSGEGPVTLAVNRAARPCAWMNAVVGPGAQRALLGKGGVRCTPLSDGALTLGEASFSVVTASHSTS